MLSCAVLYCDMFQYVVLCLTVLSYGAMYCSVLNCVVVCCDMFLRAGLYCVVLHYVELGRSVLFIYFNPLCCAGLFCIMFQCILLC